MMGNFLEPIIHWSGFVIFLSPTEQLVPMHCTVWSKHCIHSLSKKEKDGMLNSSCFFPFFWKLTLTSTKCNISHTSNILYWFPPQFDVKNGLLILSFTVLNQRKPFWSRFSPRKPFSPFVPGYLIFACPPSVHSCRAPSFFLFDNFDLHTYVWHFWQAKGKIRLVDQISLTYHISDLICPES